MLLEFNAMDEKNIYRMVHEIYSEASYEIAKEKHPEIEKIEDFYYMEALETAPEHRKKGYASQLISEVIALLKTRGEVIMRSNVRKTNEASLVI